MAPTIGDYSDPVKDEMHISIGPKLATLCAWMSIAEHYFIKWTSSKPSSLVISAIADEYAVMFCQTTASGCWR